MKDLFNDKISKRTPDMNDFQREVFKKNMKLSREAYETEEKRKNMLLKVALVIIWALVVIWLYVARRAP